MSPLDARTALPRSYMSHPSMCSRDERPPHAPAAAVADVNPYRTEDESAVHRVPLANSTSNR